MKIIKNDCKNYLFAIAFAILMQIVEFSQIWMLQMQEARMNIHYGY